MTSPPGAVPAPGELARLLAWAASTGPPVRARAVRADRHHAAGRRPSLDAPGRAGHRRPRRLAGDDLPGAHCVLRPARVRGRARLRVLRLPRRASAAGQAFAAFMASRSARLATAIAALDFTASWVIADIGGGHGTILASVLAAPAPHPRRPARSASEARAWLATAGVGARAEVVACDSRPEADPGGRHLPAGQHPAKHDDTDACAILGALARAATAGPRLIVAEILLPDDPAPHIGYDLDIRMMALGRGRERTRAAYCALLTYAGLTVTAITRTTEAFAVIDAQPVAHDPACSGGVAHREHS